MESPPRPATAPAGSSARRLVVDGHVHLHPCYELAAFLDAGRRNLAAGAARLGSATPDPGVLFLTDSWGVRRFREILDGPLPRRAGGWSIDAGPDATTALARHDDGHRLLLVDGRQVASSERLEVLALGCSAEVPDGLTMDETLARVLATGGSAVIPWGFGKFWGARGRRVEQLLDGQDPRRVFLGDNGGRLRYALRPPQFARAETRGFRVIPGSDPLPFPREFARVGSYGFALDVNVEGQAPTTAHLLERLGAPGPGFEGFGRRNGLVSFAVSQVAMQLRRPPATDG